LDTVRGHLTQRKPHATELSLRCAAKMSTGAFRTYPGSVRDFCFQGISGRALDEPEWPTLGQNRTSERLRFMSAQAPKAELQATQCNVAVVP
jgi:hypothetical protein